jgi:hypothetical protein
MLDDAEELYNTLCSWGGPIRWVAAEGAHLLVSEEDHTRSSIVTAEAWEAVQGRLSAEGNDLYKVA